MAWTAGHFQDFQMAQDFGAPDRVFDMQKQLQAVHKLTHLKGPRDKVTSVVIPGVLLAACFTLVVHILNS